eukprot:14370835-Heterocapsa_arctica.AAC.1
MRRARSRPKVAPVLVEPSSAASAAGSSAGVLPSVVPSAFHRASLANRLCLWVLLPDGSLRRRPIPICGATSIWV